MRADSELRNRTASEAAGEGTPSETARPGPAPPVGVTGDDVSYAMDLVRRICTDVGPGVPGSAQERQRAAVLREELAVHLGAGNVAVEEFTVAPGATWGSARISALFTVIAALLNLSAGRIAGLAPAVTAALAVGLAALSGLVFVLQFTLDIELVDPLFAKKRSVNVIGTLRRPGTSGVERLLIVSGHHDSAWEMRWLALLGYGFYFMAFTIFAGLGVVGLFSLVQLAGALLGDAGLVGLGTLAWPLVVYPLIPYVIFAMTMSRGGKDGGTVPGAADNLSGSSLVAALCRLLTRNPSCIPADTEIRFITFGSEEAGLRGSKRYVERHRDELKRLDARVLNFEIIAYPEIAILTTDLSSTVRNSPEMVASVVRAAERAGVPHPTQPYPMGGGASDAGFFSRAGVKAATLNAFKTPQQIIAFYHQRRDRPEVLTPEPLGNALRIAFEWVRGGGA